MRIKGYNCIYKNRDKTGGGVAIIVKKEIQYSCLDMDSDN